ncbi:ectomycorrhizas-regulated small secreted protein [Ephemerocybe angulata]|uniref:Ectomycorrhizas-regulated small secreted protein n=1 Tax=Ephemerocybe angulata TaxID=980116 RepID=A0A8H6M1K8_9AGAR|nr:ectomycorrhizas-regulated small secreted protein [Tulosesus angulatus]
MRFNVLVLVPTVVALASYVQGHYDEFDARDTREIQSLLRRSEMMEELAEISTRDLIDELSSRLEARFGKKYICSKCNTEYKTDAERRACESPSHIHAHLVTERL